MKCPRDGATLSTKIYEADVEVDVCGSCGGVWLDAGELEAIQRIVERDHSADERGAALRLLGGASGRDDPIACPKCLQTMEKREHGYCSGVIVDSCVLGHGVWLDAGELEALERFYEEAQREADSDFGLKLQLLWLRLTGARRRS